MAGNLLRIPYLSICQRLAVTIRRNCKHGSTPIHSCIINSAHIFLAWFNIKIKCLWWKMSRNYENSSNCWNLCSFCCGIRLRCSSFCFKSSSFNCSHFNIFRYHDRSFHFLFRFRLSGFQIPQKFCTSTAKPTSDNHIQNNCIGCVNMCGVDYCSCLGVYCTFLPKLFSDIFFHMAWTVGTKCQ